MKRCLAALALVASGCAVHAVQVKQLTVPPQSAPVVVTGTCRGTSTDFILAHQAKAELSLVDSSGQQGVPLAQPGAQ